MRVKSKRPFNRTIFLMISIPASLVCLSPIIGQPVDGHNISGELIKDMTWSGICVVEDIIVVPKGIVLKIELGTVILRDGVVNFPDFALFIDDWFYMR